MDQIEIYKVEWIDYASVDWRVRDTEQEKKEKPRHVVLDFSATCIFVKLVTKVYDIEVSVIGDGVTISLRHFYANILSMVSNYVTSTL